MDFNDVWLKPTEKLENGEKEGQSMPNSLRSVRSPLQEGHHSLKKIQLFPLANELATSSLPGLEFASPSPPVTNIKPPPTIFTDLWVESDNSSSEPDEVPHTDILNPNQTGEEHQYLLVSGDPLFVSEGKSKATMPLELDSMLDGLWENEIPTSEEAGEGWIEHATNSFDALNIFEDLDLFDIDAVLAKQEAEIQQQEYEREREVALRESRFERWGGVSSLIYVNWDNPETAEQDALERLGYANIALSEETRAFIIQAARNARLPHRQEIQLTTQLANSRMQLASLPPYNEEETIDPYAARRQALQAEITEIEQTLTCKMQWVAIKKAVQFLGQGIELDDLIQFGMLGVIAGVQHFDITRKARLLIAVNTWTFQALTRAIADYGSAIRLPAHLFEQVYMLRKQHLQWQLIHGCLPTRQQLAEKMDISLKDLTTILKAEEILRSSKKPQSIEHLIHAEQNDEGYSFQTLETGLIANGDISVNILNEINGQQISHSLFQYLTPRERLVFSLRAGLDEDGNGEFHTLEEIGRTLKITRERVRQIEDKARRKIQSQLRKTSPVTNASPKAEETAKAVPDDKSAQKQTRNSERAIPSPSSMHTPHITKKYVQEIKRKWKEQREQEAEQRRRGQEVK